MSTAMRLVLFTQVANHAIVYAKRTRLQHYYRQMKTLELGYTEFLFVSGAGRSSINQIKTHVLQILAKS